MTVKGKQEPIPLWRAAGAMSPLGSEIDHAATPFIGRDRELAMLVSTLQRVREERTPRLATLVGVPGIGRVAASA